MPVKDYSVTPSSNTSINGIAIGEGAPRANMNDAIRQLMADMKSKALEAISLDDAGGGSGSAATDAAAWTEVRAHLIARGGGTIRLSNKQYLLNSTFALNTDSFSIPLAIEGQGAASDVLFVGGDVPAIQIGGSVTYMRGGALRNFKLRNQAGGGHLLQTGAFGAVSLTVQDMTLEQNVPNRRILNIPSGEVYVSKFEGGDWTAHPSSSVSPVYIRADGTTFNINTFQNLRCFQSNAAQFFDIANADDETWLVHNAFRDIDFGICPGGGLRLRNVRGTMIENISFFDATQYTGHLVWFASDSAVGYESTANTIINVERHGDTLATGIRDIFTERADFTTVINAFTPLANSPSYDWNNKNVIVIGLLYGEINTNNRFGFNGGQVVLPNSIANAANDAAAASAGVPLFGIYRNGNALQVRLT